MKLFLQAEEPFAVRADGNFLGNFYGCAAIEAAPSFIEVLPHSGKEPVCFFADYRLISHENAIVYDIPSGLFVRVFFRRREKSGFRLLYQKRFDDLLVTAYIDGGVKLTVENERDAQIISVPIPREEFSAELHGDKLAVFSEGSPSFVALLKAAGDLEPLFCKVVDEFEFTPVFLAKTRLFDLERTTVSCEWQESGGKFTPAVKSVSRENPWKPDLPEKVTERIFFERISGGLETEELLSENMRKNADKLRGYLGEFDGVLPSFCSEKGVCLSYKGNGRRPVKTFSVDLENELICNIREI
ncbi:MAG: hypothetical protein IJU84_07000 [Clostridia bacterium]|nr:hypothetical protein [Clostridia bacterium]